MHLRHQHRECEPREIYLSGRFRKWVVEVLPTLQPTVYAQHESPKVEVAIILGRFEVGARLTIEPDESIPGDLKRLRPIENSIWELKTGDIRIFGWFHDFDCFVAHSGDDATYTKANGLYKQHVDDALTFLSESGLQAREGAHQYVISL